MRSPWLTALLLLALALAACQVPPGAVLIGPTRLPDQPTPTRAPTARPTATPTPTPLPTHTPTATVPPQWVEPTEAPVKIGPFINRLALDWAPPGVITDLFAEDSQIVWFATRGGLARLDVPAETFQQTKFEAPATILGFQPGPTPRVWLIRSGGRVVSAWDGSAYTDFSRDQGWVTAAEPLQPPLDESFAVSPAGAVWISTARDVRRFDGTQWRVFPPGELGLGLPYRAGRHASFLVALAGDQAWAGDCWWEGRDPLPNSGGLVRFDGSTWDAAGAPQGCVSALQSDRSGGVWAAVEGRLWRYRPVAGWQPIGPSGGLITRITPAPDGAAWLTRLDCNAGQCGTGGQTVRVRDGQWVVIRASELAEQVHVLFDNTGAPWLIGPDGVQRLLPDDTLEEVANLQVDAAATDPAGDLWLVTNYRIDARLWWLPAQ